MAEQKRTGIIQDITKIEKGARIPLSDFQIAFSSDDGTPYLVNLDLEEEESDKTTDYKIQPGLWRITPKQGMMPLEYEKKTYFETETYEQLSKYFDNFLSGFDVYEKLGIPKKRGILLGSVPGCGKSSLLNHFISQNLKQFDGACVLRIDSEQISWEVIMQMFLKSKATDAKFIMLVIEDIGGTGIQERNNGYNISAELLNFLDGTSDTYKIPTLIVGTTNYIDNVGQTLSDRPGRFDVVHEVSPPTIEECFQLMEDFLQKLYPNRKLSDLEKSLLKKDKLTPAYCQEIVIRSALTGNSLEETIQEVLDQKKKSTKRNHANQGGRDVGFR